MKPKGGELVLTRSRALGLLIAFVGSLVAVALLVYFFADRPYSAAVDDDDSSAAKIISSSKRADNVRLPRTVLPRHYDIRLLPILEKGNFSILGHVSIDIECQQDTDRIVMHSFDIAVDPKSVRLVQQGEEDQPMMVHDIGYDTERDFLNINLCQKHKVKLFKGRNYTLSMDFVGNLTDKLKGLYRSSYQEDGEEKWAH